MTYKTEKTPAIYCPKCKARGPIHAVRLIAQTRDLTDEDGEDIVLDTTWIAAGTVRKGMILNCGCGHSWHTRRNIPAFGEL